MQHMTTTAAHRHVCHTYLRCLRGQHGTQVLLAAIQVDQRHELLADLGLVHGYGELETILELHTHLHQNPLCDLLAINIYRHCRNTT